MFKHLHGRQANPASRFWNIAKTLIQTAVFWTVFLLLLPLAVYSLETWLGLSFWRFPSVAARAAGIVLFVAGGTLGITSGVVMSGRGEGTPLPLDCPRVLVVAGPYRFVRNPMAIAGIGQGLAVGLFMGSPAVILYALTGAPVWHYLVRPWEELDMVERFGAPYQHYREQLKCWVPSRTPYDGSAVQGGSNGDSPAAEGENSSGQAANEG